jgi:hypothetical protein
VQFKLVAVQSEQDQLVFRLAKRQHSREIIDSPSAANSAQITESTVPISVEFRVVGDMERGASGRVFDAVESTHNHSEEEELRDFMQNYLSIDASKSDFVYDIYTLGRCEIYASTGRLAKVVFTEEQLWELEGEDLSEEEFGQDEDSNAEDYWTHDYPDNDNLYLQRSDNSSFCNSDSDSDDTDNDEYY